MSATNKDGDPSRGSPSSTNIHEYTDDYFPSQDEVDAFSDIVDDELDEDADENSSWDGNGCGVLGGWWHTAFSVVNKDPDLSDRAVRIYLDYLSWWQSCKPSKKKPNGQPWVFMTNKQLAETYGCSTASVDRAVLELKKHGLLETAGRGKVGKRAVHPAKSRYYDERSKFSEKQLREFAKQRRAEKSRNK